MKKYVLKRLIHAVFIMWLVATTLFFGLRAVPGGPAYAILGRDASQENVENLREQLGLTDPIHEQYVDWLVNLVQLDLGSSLSTGQAVADVLLTAAPKTVSIGILAIGIGLAVAIPAGIVSATRRGELPDTIGTLVAFLGLSAPAFFIGIVLMVVFGVWFDLLPVFGYTPISEGPIRWFQSIILPATAVGLPYAAIIMRMMRSSLLDVLNEPYMKSARAKGIDKRVRLFKHALQNALIPVVTVAGVQLAVIVGGSVTVEIVFGIRGMGRVMVDSLTTRDYPVTQGAILLIAFGLIMINLLVDILYTIIDPRIGYDGGNR
ncbi:ABC transporter permease [Halovivax cerinus]|uniref:ABC transporter permease n=1 Tax=Halovivax cerinus TaxID=1487865 RepID=A0ABD5NRE6_9EURY|nr:ABC transporter permease [Halovivax cerinus]